MTYDFYKLKNGLRVMLVPMEGVQSVALGVYVGTGSRFETEKINGISHFLEHMVFKGTKKFPTHQDTSYLEGLGAIQNAWTDVDATAYWCKVPADKWKEGLELIKELALYPQIPNADLEIERGVILEEINRREDRPDELVSEELYKLMFKGHNLGMTVLGEPEVIKAVTREDFLAYHKSHYTAGNMVVTLVGKLADIQGIKDSISSWFDGLPAEANVDSVRFENKQAAPQIIIKEKDLAQQAHIEIGFKGITLSDPRRFALGVLTSYLGQGLSSRLFTELREKRGLCYSVHASDEKYVDTGIWGVYAGLSLDKLEEAISAIIAEISRLKIVKLTDAELVAAREKLRGPMLFSMENPINQMNFYAKQALDRPENILTYQDIEKELMKVDASMIQSVAESIFKIETLNIAIVGPITADRGQKILGNIKI